MSYPNSPMGPPDDWIEGQFASRTMMGSHRHFFSPSPIHKIEGRIVIALPVLSLAILSVYFLRNVLQRALPGWLRPFAQEEKYDEEDEVSPPRKQTRWTVWTLLLGVICAAGVVLAGLPAMLVYPRQPIAILEVVPWLASLLIWSYDRPVKAPRLLLLLFLFILTAYVARYSVRFLNHTLVSLDPYRLGQSILSLVGIIVIANMPLRGPELSSGDIGSPKSNNAPSSSLRSPEDDLTLFQFWTMKWVYPLAKIATKRELVVKDVWQLPYEFQHSRLYLAFRDLKGDMLWRLGRANGLDLAIASTCSAADRVAEVSNIRLTSKLYQALDHGDFEEAVFWCLIMLAIEVGRQLARTTSMWYARKAYERSRGETFIALFGKVLTRVVAGSDMTEEGANEDQDEKDEVPDPIVWFFSRYIFRRSKYTLVQDQEADPNQPASNAKIINLLRGDTYEISQRFWELCKFFSAPIKFVFTAYYLYSIMGWPALVGGGTMFMFFGINYLLTKVLIRLEKKRTKLSDKRAQAVANFVEESRPLKLNGWTEFWQQRIMSFRKPEMRKRLHMSYMTALIQMTTMVGGMIYPLASIGLYTLIEGQRLPNEVIWPSLQLFVQLESVTKEIFDLIAATWKATIPVGRVRNFMAEPDRDEQPEGSNTHDISFEDASFAWPHTDKPVLQGLSLSFPPGLTIIKGNVGTGKSSLLLSALNEMELRSGNLIRPNEPIGYAKQLPWLQDKSIRDNIVFHERFDPQRYKDTLHACALGPDLATLPAGHNTRLEEGGAGLSGGQKARVALARAVYSSCRILLLDDPLAALDHDTASLIVRRFLQGPLAQGRTIVMVTHRDELVLRFADQVIETHDGTARILTRAEIQEELEHPRNRHTETDDVDGSGNANGHSEGHVDVSEEVLKPADEPEEAGRTGTVKLSVYTKYMKAGGWYLWVFLAISYVISRFCEISRGQVLEAWGADTAADISATALSNRFWGLPDPERYPKVWVAVLGAFSLGQVAFYSIAQYLLARICFHAASGLFEKAIDKVSKARFRYYDTTPSGQLKNRLIADMGMVDGGILTPLEGFIYNLITLLASLGAILFQQPVLLIFLGAMSLLFMYFFSIYVPTSRCLRRMEMRYLTPIIANVGVMQHGLVTIRALRVEKHFQDRHLDAVDDFQKQDHFYWSMSFWLEFRLSMSSALMKTALILFMVWYGTPASAIGFILTQTTVAVAMVQQLCEKFATLQLDAISLERVDMLNHIPEEPSGDEQPPEDWPGKEDNIRFENMSFQYDVDLPKVLNDVSFEIPGGSTCAVLGRTGSGKSTIANALLVTDTPSSGSVKIGGYDLSFIDRSALRNRVTFIQQDPVLFPGTLRDNIDPQGQFSDSECENAIHRVLGRTWSLDTRIDAGGQNLSQGERQLASIGRAIVRRSGLVILDEATASIDRKTAAKVQRLLREELAGSTVVTIAHRLEAVEDAGWCLRLDAGRVQECGPARNLNGKGKEGD